MILRAMTTHPACLYTARFLVSIPKTDPSNISTLGGIRTHKMTLTLNQPTLPNLPTRVVKVDVAGLEPALLAKPDFESGGSTNSPIRPSILLGGWDLNPRPPHYQCGTLTN